MKKSLLIWNVIVTVVALVLIFTACTSDSRVTSLQNQLQQEQVAIANLQNEISGLKSADAQLTAYIQQNQNSIASLESTMIQIVTRINN